MAVGLRLGLSVPEIEKGILALESVEGRMNRVNEGQDFEVIVDYAHTPDAFLKVFESVVPGKKKRIISLFGGDVVTNQQEQNEVKLEQKIQIL